MDIRANKAGATKNTHMSKIIYFVRHGESRSNVEGVYSGSRYDVALTELGFQQARAAANKLQGKTIDLIVSSPLKRAQQTAQSIAAEINYPSDVLLQPLLQERDFGEATGHKWRSAIEAQIDAGTVKDLETVEQLGERMQRLLDWFKSVPSETMLAVGHGTAERMLQTIYLGKPPATFLETRELGNTEIRKYLLD